MKKCLILVLLVLLTACASSTHRSSTGKQEELARQKEARQQEEAREQEEARQQEKARKQEEARKEEDLRRRQELAQIEERQRQRSEDNGDPELLGMLTEEQRKKSDRLLSNRRIYYDWDKSEIKQKYVPVVAAHARFLIAHPAVKVVVEGNCDERGTPAYNVALGQRRAESVQSALLAKGVPAGQVETVSFGAERPIARGKNKESWALNRRADVVYPKRKR